MLKRALTPLLVAVLATSSVVVPAFVGAGVAFGQVTPERVAAARAALIARQQQAAAARAQRDQAIGSIRQAINANRDNPAELANALANLIANNPGLANFIDQAVAGVTGINAPMAQAIGQGMAQAVNRLLLAGNTAAAQAVNAEVIQVQAAIANNPTSGASAAAAAGSGYQSAANQAIAADNAAGTAAGAAAATAFASLLSAGSSSGGGSSSRS